MNKAEKHKKDKESSRSFVRKILGIEPIHDETLSIMAYQAMVIDVLKKGIKKYFN